MAARALVAPTVVSLAAFAALLALGTWQLERLTWKEGLIAALDERLAQLPAPLPPAADWSRLNEGADEFRRVRFAAEFLHDEEALVYAGTSSLRRDISGPGYWVFTPARVAGGIVLVNRGFVPEGRQDPASRRDGLTAGPVPIVGALRWPEPRNPFTPSDAPGKNLWFVRDPAAIAAAKGLASIAPFYVEQEAPAPPGGLPRPGRLEPNLPNNHLGYAIIWFGLAAVLAAVYSGWLRARLRV
jgi:surfeit locus 1 family protein